MQQPLVIQTSDPDLRVLNPEVLNGAGVVIIPPGVQWMPFVVTPPPTYDEPESGLDHVSSCGEPGCDRDHAAEVQAATREAYVGGAPVHQPRCTATHPENGLQCDGPAGHPGQHAAYSSDTGFTRHWSTTIINGNPA